MTRTFITLALATFAFGAHAGGMAHAADPAPRGGFAMGTTEALSQSSATRPQAAMDAMHAGAGTDGAMSAHAMSADADSTKAMGAPSTQAWAAPSQWPMGSTEVLSQSRATRQ